MTEVKSAAIVQVPVVGTPSKKSVKAKSIKAKKPAAADSKKPRAPRNYPSFQVMISDAIVALKERTGSSQIAITKYIEDNHKNLPPNFRKLLLNQLKRLVTAEKLVKVKASFKLPSARSSSTAVSAYPASKKSAVENPKATKLKAAAAAATTKPKAKPAAGAATKPKAKSAKPTTAAAKPAANAHPKRKAADVAAPKLGVKPSKSKKAKTASISSVKSPGKKVAAKPKKVVPKPKSVKSPIKKTAAAAKKSRK